MRLNARRSAALLLALGLDAWPGDPPNRFHPVAWMGSLIAWARRHRPTGQPAAEFVYGAGVVLLGGALAAAAGGLVEALGGRLPGPLGLLAEAALLKTTFTWRGLDRAANEVQQALEAGDLPEARRTLSWHLVSRDTSQLDESQVAAAAIESVAENASDSLVAPLLYYALGGLPLALAYRFANTCDAMLGYHTPELEWLGKFPARLDDLANLLPARLTGLLLTAAARLAGGSPQSAWRSLRRDARRTESPNAGYPMSAMAGALGVELEKVGHYRLGAGNRAAQPEDIRRARRILAATVGLAVGGLAWLALRPRRPGCRR
jgi:adenosylcobinamide-phosphate synthase